MIAGSRVFIFLILSGMALSLEAQSYQAIHGSSYAGSLGVTQNPSAIVLAPYAWDITPLALQLKYSTNAVKVFGYSLFGNTGQAEVRVVEGQQSRYWMQQQDLRLLNTRIRINAQSAIAFGMNIRSGSSIQTSPFNWQDSMKSARDFMMANLGNSPLNAQLRASGWAEVFGTYARTVYENDFGTLNAGLTLKINRGLAGAYLNGQDLYLLNGQLQNHSGSLLNDGVMEFGYSSNLDDLDGPGTARDIRKQFLKRTWSAVSLDLGTEYIMSGGDGFYDYDLKLGVSLLDLGYNKYQYSVNSRRSVLNKVAVSDSLIDAAFGNVDGSDAAADSLASIVADTRSVSGFYRIAQPARIVLNADKHIAGNFYLNAELTIPLTPVLGRNSLYVRELNLLSVTPRFETRSLGLYLPVTLNSRNQLWVGAAVKAGPLLLGLHNLSNVFASDKMASGGAYMALHIRPWKKKNGEDDEAPGGRKEKGVRSGGRKGNRLGCPTNVY